MKYFNSDLDNWRQDFMKAFPDQIVLTERELWIEEYFLDRIVPMDIEHLISFLKKRFIHLQMNWELIKHGIRLREQLVQELQKKTVADKPELKEGEEKTEDVEDILTMNEAKLHELRLNIFKKLAEHNKLLAQMIDEISGTLQEKASKVEELEEEIAAEFSADMPGFAQQYLKDKQ